MRKRLVLVGGGHAHLYTLRQTAKLAELGISVVLVAPRLFWYSGTGPGIVSGSHAPDQGSVNLQSLVQRRGGAFIEDEAIRIDASNRRVFLRKHSPLSYDALSLNVGSQVSTEDIPGAEEYGITVKPISNLVAVRKELIASEARGCEARIVVIGGGDAGCELVANIGYLLSELNWKERPTLVSATLNLMENHGANAGLIMTKYLRELRTNLVLGAKVIRVHAGAIELENDATIPFDLLVIATGIRPSTLMRSSGLPVAFDGSLQVNRSLQCVSYPEIFATGDGMCFDGRILPRMCVYAVRQPPVLYHNLTAYMAAKDLRPFHPQRSYLLILNLGDGTGLLSWRRLANRSRPAFWLKDWIDRRFVAEFSR